MTDTYKSYLLTNTDDGRILFQSLDENGIIIDIDQTWLDYMGYEKRDVIGKLIGEFITIDSLYGLEQDFNDLKKYGKITDITLKLKKRDGSKHESILNAISTYGEHEIYERLDNMLHDIDLYKNYRHKAASDHLGIVNKLKMKITNNYQFIQRLLDSRSEIIAIIKDDEIIHANRALLHFFRVASLQEFNDNRDSISTHIDTEKDPFLTNTDDTEHWIETLALLDASDRIIYMQDSQDIQHTFQVIMHAMGHSADARHILTFVDVTKTYVAKKVELAPIVPEIEEEISKETLFDETEQIAKIGSWEWDSLSEKIHLSKGIKHILSMTEKASTFKAEELYHYIHPDDRPMAYRHLKKTVKNRDNTEFICRIIADPSNIQYIKVVVRVKEPKAETIRLIGIIFDVTEHYTAKEALKREHSLLQTMIDGIDYSVMMIRPDYTIELMNETAQESLDKSYITDMQNPRCYEVSHHRSAPCDGADHPCPMMDVMSSGSPSTVLHSHSDGSFSELLAVPLKDEQGNIYAITESERDITTHMEVQNELRMQKQVLAFQAEHDTLTGLPNRALFMDRLQQSIKNARRGYTKTALLFIDLDHFKEINDTLGHAMGDKVLIEVANKLHHNVREVDTVARLSGDEFTIILENITNMDDITEIARKILHTFQQPMQIDGMHMKSTMSIGISTFPDDGNTPEELLQNADTAMYKAKNSGKNRYHYYASSMTERIFERSVTESCLRNSIDSDKLLIYYQPQINAESNTVIGVEALVRWDLADLGIVLPSQFMPLAEESSLQQNIDNWVMRQAMTQTVQWYEQGLRPGRLSLNLSMKQLLEDDFLSQLHNALHDTGCKAQWLIIELKEEQILLDTEKAIIRLQQIKDLGVGLTIDDFGMGTTSLKNLIRLPVTRLKIDDSFVRNIPESKKDADLVRSVIALTKSIDLKVTAKGVETDAQQEFLMHEGCQDLQGYLYGQPMPADQMGEYLLKNKEIDPSAA